MTNMSQFSDEMDEISFVESSSIFDETDIQRTFQSTGMRGPSENIVQPDSPVAGTSGSSLVTAAKNSVQTASPVTVTSGS